MSFEHNEDRFEELLGRVLDDAPPAGEIAELVQLARDNPARGDTIRLQLEADEMIRLAEDDLRDSSLFASALRSRLFEDPFVRRFRGGLSRQRTLRSLLPWALAASLILALALWRVPWQTTVEASVAELVETQGAIQWTGDGGRVETSPVAGRALPAGTIESLGPDAWATLKFPDATEVTIAGDSSLTISSAGPDKDERDGNDRTTQKHWYLKRGSLSASVSPQPPGQPLLVSTPAATLHVAGKVRVAAGAVETNVSVDAGTVRVERALDGAVIEVPAGHRAVAPMAVGQALRIAPTGAPVSSWVANLEAEVHQGEWMDDLVALRRRLSAAIDAGELTSQEARRQFADHAPQGPLGPGPAGSLHAVLSPGSDGLYVIALTLSADRGARVVLTEGNRVRVRGRVQTPADVVVGLGVGVPGGAPKTRVVAAPQRVRGEFDVVLPLSAFRLRGAGDVPPMGMELFSWFAWTRDRDGALEITGVELLEPGNDTPTR